MCVYWICTTSYTHAVVYTHKVLAGAAPLSEIMLPKTQLSGVKPQTVRGDAVRNVYRHRGGGRPRATELHVHSVAQRKREKISVPDSGFQTLDLGLDLKGLSWTHIKGSELC